ncbi:MAG: hypothetical protein IIU51_09770 [Bacteroidaceae bacterium]|nr:hypothetical protein [Bacteroidaceae bacterium]
MKCKLHILATPEEPVTSAQVICFAHQLKKDLTAESPKLSWEHDSAKQRIGVYVSSGLSPGSKIIIEPFATAMQSGIRLSYLRNEEPIFSAYELSGRPTDEHALRSLYAAVASTVVKSSVNNCRHYTPKHKLE